MIVEFDKSFLKSLSNLRDPKILLRLENTITDLEKID